MTCDSRKRGMSHSRISWTSLIGLHSTLLFTWTRSWRVDSSSSMKRRLSERLRLLSSCFAVCLVGTSSSQRTLICLQIDCSIRRPCRTVQSSVWSNNCRLNAVTILLAKWKPCSQTCLSPSKLLKNSGTPCAMAMTLSMKLSSTSRY